MRLLVPDGQVVGHQQSEVVITISRRMSLEWPWSWNLARHLV
jgi:hypothetical protein